MRKELKESKEVTIVKLVKDERHIKLKNKKFFKYLGEYNNKKVLIHDIGQISEKAILKKLNGNLGVYLIKEETYLIHAVCLIENYSSVEEELKSKEPKQAEASGDAKLKTTSFMKGLSKKVRIVNIDDANEFLQSNDWVLVNSHEVDGEIKMVIKKV